MDKTALEIGQVVLILITAVWDQSWFKIQGFALALKVMKAFTELQNDEVSNICFFLSNSYLFT